MSYAMSAALQRVVYQALTQSVALQAVVGTAIFDAPPTGSLPSIYVSLGPESAIAQSDVTARGARHDFVISVVTDAAGFQAAKDAAGIVSDILAQPLAPLDRGQLVNLSFHKARALRDEAAQLRRIDLIFRARLDDI
jgi:hypothetical protein